MKTAHGSEKGKKPRRAPGEYAKFALILPLLLLLLVVFGLQDQYPLIKSFIHWAAMTILVLTVYVSGVGRKYFLAVASFALVAAALEGPAQSYHVPAWIILVPYVALVALGIVAILRRVGRLFAEEGVDAEVVLGALCAYLYIGWGYAMLYLAVADLSNAPFFAQPGSDDSLNFLYFSFVTLTTVGYGDLSPAYGPGRMLAATEAIVGQLYLVSVVSLVVSAYGRRR